MELTSTHTLLPEHAGQKRKKKLGTAGIAGWTLALCSVVVYFYFKDRAHFRGYSGR